MTVRVGPVELSDKAALVVGIGAVLLVVGGVWYVRYKAGQVADAINPLNRENVVNTTVNKVLAPVLGTNPNTKKSNTLGQALYYWFNDDD